MLRIATMVAIAGAFAGSLNATSISGSFDLNGSTTLSANTISWISDAAVAGQATLENNSDLSGSFVGLGNTLVAIENLNKVTEPVGIGFASQDFINFLAPAAASFPQLDITFIAPGSGGTTDCTLAPAAGQTCTPAMAGGSPFTFLNVFAGPTIIDSSLTFDFSGVTSDGKSAWNGIFTSQFNEPFQSVLGTLFTSGSITNSYSDSNLVITNSSPTPEPGAGGLVFVGLLLLAALRLRS